MNDFFQGFGILLVGVIVFIALSLGFLLLRVLIRFTTDTVGQIVRAVTRLLFTTVFDLRFCCTISVVFCLLAERDSTGNFPKIAFILSSFAFIFTLFNIATFLILSTRFRRIQTASQSIADAQVGKVVNDVALQIQLNVGFLGLVFLFFSYTSTCFSYYALLDTIGEGEYQKYQWVVSEDALLDSNDKEELRVASRSKVTYDLFVRHTWWTIQSFLPNFIQKQIGLASPEITAPDDAIGLWILSWVFNKAFWAACFALLWAILQPSRIFHAL